ncbi:MAG TPA: metal-dependent hydrolase [Vicinamibacterales bacterium]
MDNVTHTLFGLTLARTPLGRAGRGTTAALLIASNAPDVDIISAARGGFVSYLRWHRGPTHGPLGVVGLGVATAAIVWVFHRGTRKPSASFLMLTAVSMIAIALHVLMDFPTSYGTRLLSPFDWRWFAVDWMPIVDIYLLMAIGAGLFFGRGSAAARSRNAALVLMLMAANYGVRAAAHHQALQLAPRLFGPTLPSPCPNVTVSTAIVDAWPRRMSSLDPPAPARRCLVEMAALPTFFSPFSWRVIAQFSNAYELHDINLLDARFQGPASESEVLWRRAVRYPNVWNDAIRRAAATQSAQVFLGFSRFPAARSVVERDGSATVRFSDVRFLTSGFVDEIRRSDPFTVVVRTSADGRITEEAFGR